MPNISATFGLRIDNMSSKVHFGLMTNTLICMTSYEAISRQPSSEAGRLSTGGKVHYDEVDSFSLVTLHNLGVFVH